MKNAIVQGSIGAIAQREGKSLAETFMSCDIVIIMDTSGSMGAHDSRGGQSRYEIACEELRNLQNSLPGKIALINFSSDVQFEPSGMPMFLQGGTNLAGALQFVKMADLPGIRFIVISDGEPDDEQRALSVAGTFKNKIDVVYVGPEDRPHGRAFLELLARKAGGQAITADRAKELQTGIQALLGAGR